MIAAGIDIGGTKIEAQLFDVDWQASTQNRIKTPENYDELLSAIGEQIKWIRETSDKDIPIGVAAPGLVETQTGLAFTANLAAMRHPFPADINRITGHHVPYINDCRALAISEAIFGAGKDCPTVLSLVLGTGIGGGIAVNGKLIGNPSGLGGEFGHMAAPAHLIFKHGLPVFNCGCGRAGCFESYISGPGLQRLVFTMTGEKISPPDFIENRKKTSDFAEVWQVWCQFTADMINALILTLAPDRIVLGGGLSLIDGVISDLCTELEKDPFARFHDTGIYRAEGGDASGARGAAYIAHQERQS